METVQVREARWEDMETLRCFEQGVIAAERPFDRTLKQSDAQYYDLPYLLNSSDTKLVVAEIEQAVVGCGYARLETSKPYLQHRRHAYLGFMYVLPEHRGKGINQLIMDNLKQWVLSKGVSEFRLEVYAGNAAAIRAYQKAGFEPLLVQMRLGIHE